MADSSLSKQTLVFGLSLCIVAGVGVAFVLLLFLFSIWFFSKRTSPPANLRSQNPTPKSLYKEVAVALPAAVDCSQVKSQPFPSYPAKIDGIERQALFVRPDCASAETAGAVAAPEVSHLGWGHWYTLRELENATNCFAQGNVIGEGGYGIVHCGVLDDNTVKNLFNNRGQTEKEFRVEVEATGRVRHKCLVRLIGCCAEGAQRTALVPAYARLLCSCW